MTQCNWCGNNHHREDCPLQHIAKKIDDLEQKLDEITTAILAEPGETPK